jgi:catechol 2,3-dioxygenase-like lactoylglutathione lyase family enzyme
MSLSSAPPVCFIITRDRAAAQAFYGDVLGLPFVGDDGFAAIYALAGSQLRITELPDHAPSPHPVLGWSVKDIEAVVRDLSGKGVTFSIYEGMGQDALGIWTAPDGSAKVAFFNDPDGNGLSLTEVIASR